MRIRWTDENWLMLMQIYLKKPAGVKPLYSRDIVGLALRLHFSPKYLYRKMFSLRRLETPQIERLWNTYSKNPGKLAKEVGLLKAMEGFNNAESFYDGVEVNESFEADFRPVPGHDRLTPIMLIMILDLYFRLTPNTMVPETPEVKALAKTWALARRSSPRRWPPTCSATPTCATSPTPRNGSSTTAVPSGSATATTTPTTSLL